MGQYLRISRYDPAVAHTGTTTWTSVSDVNSRFEDGILTLDDYLKAEALYLSAVEAVLAAMSIDELIVANVGHSVNGLELREGQHLARAEALQLCRLELREETSCTLFGVMDFYVEFGYDYYMYIGAASIPEEVIVDIERAGLFVEHDRLPPHMLGQL